MENLFKKGEFLLHSGQRSNFKIDCDALTDEDIETLAEIIANKITFGAVVPVPTGGNRLAQALCKFVSKESETFLIVDDVLTTGMSMEETKSFYTNEDVIGVVIFARGKCPSWIKSIFQMWE